MTNNEEQVTPKVIEGDLPQQEVFSAYLTLRSVGNNPAIIPELRFSHELRGDLNDRVVNNQIPFSFIAMMKIAEQINAVMRPVTDAEADSLPDDPEEAARVLSAMTESKNVSRKN